jgi:hypothetical protein
MNSEYEPSSDGGRAVALYISPKVRKSRRRKRIAFLALSVVIFLIEMAIIRALLASAECTPPLPEKASMRVIPLGGHARHKAESGYVLEK